MSSTLCVYPLRMPVFSSVFRFQRGLSSKVASGLGIVPRFQRSQMACFDTPNSRAMTAISRSSMLRTLSSGLTLVKERITLDSSQVERTWR